MTKKLADMTNQEAEREEQLNMGVVFERFSAHLLVPYGETREHEYADALDPLTDATIIQDWLRLEVPRLVTEARANGASWQDIGTRLGMTRQGAQQRFA